MATKTEQSVAAAENKAQLPSTELDPELMEMSQADTGAGIRNMTMDDIGVPYLYVLQPLSPQCNPDSPTHVKGATAGMFMNSLSQEVFEGRETGLTVIPCAYERKYVEWVDRDQGGGWVADHEITSTVLSECKPDGRGRPVLGNGHLIVETAYHYVYMRNPTTGIWEELIIPMKSSFLKQSRRWNKQLTSTVIPGTDKVAPRWLYPYQLKTVKQQKDTYVWSNIITERHEQPVTKEQYLQAKKFAELFEQGSVVRSREVGTDEPGSREVYESNGQSRGKTSFADEIPF